MSPEPGTQQGPDAQKVFICYRREETAAHAGRLYDAMVARFGESNVFMDVDIAPGVDFVERITQVVSRCLVLIVVMGPRWGTTTDEDGNQRIADPDDFVRLEVETALRRPDVTPIPVLVSGARMPKREALPEALQPLTRRNALDLSDARWAYDVGRLNSTLDVLLDEVPEPRETGADPYPTPMPISPPTPAPTPAVTGEPAREPSRLILEGMAVAGAAAVLTRLLVGNRDFISKDETAYNIVETALRRGVTWALVGVALAVWLGLRIKRTDLGRLTWIGLIVGALAGALSGVIWGARVFLPEEDLGFSSSEANTIQILCQAISCGLIGALLASIWRPSRGAIGLAAGVATGVVVQLILNALGWNPSAQPGNAYNFGLTAVAVTGVVLATLLALDRQEPRTAPVRLGAAEP
ncbi:MAG: toll/interleukin-1 receptor domain-containing protein [Solirubrobacterales bacterium]